ncbi:hypothetical protein JCM8097_007157 [Rhodosporidiobolus ruineniae]
MTRKHDNPSAATISPLFNPLIASHIPPDAPHVERTPEVDRAAFADPEKKALLSACSKVDNLTGSIGTELHGIQLKDLTPQQKDELALLVAERGVVFFRDQDLPVEQQVEFFEHYGTLDTHPAQKDTKFVEIHENTFDHRDALRRHPWPLAAFHADTSFELNPPSYTMLFMREAPETDGDTVWTSQYGTYDALSPAMKKIASELHAVHSSRYQYETILTLWQGKPRRPPIDTVHPLVRSHPVTKLRALNWNPGFSIWIDELKKAESDALGKFFTDHINEAADHQVRWRWTPNSVAFWSNTVSTHRVIPGNYSEPRYGTRTTVFGEKPYLDPESEGREERRERLKREKEGGAAAGEREGAAEKEKEVRTAAVLA